MNEGQAEDGDSHAISVSTKNLSDLECLLFYQLLSKGQPGDPLLAKVGMLPLNQIGQLFQLTALIFRVSLRPLRLGLQKLSVMVEREALYQQLLQAGAPKDMLYRHFSKSRRQIEKDRHTLGIKAVHAGRPRRIDRDMAYEIAGHWDQMKGEVTDFAERLLSLHERYPDMDLTSLFRLVEDL